MFFFRKETNLNAVEQTFFKSKYIKISAVNNFLDLNKVLYVNLPQHVNTMEHHIYAIDDDWEFSSN